MRTLTRTTIGIAAGAVALALAGPALALDEIKFGTNWLAEAEHGGFYQAVADGTYEKYGLDVTIVQGGPQSPNRALLTGGQVDFFMSGNMLAPMHAQTQEIPLIEVAAIFQKDPQVLIAHPDTGIETFADLAKVSKLIMGNEGFGSYFQWMKWQYDGFSDEQYEPYHFNPAPFLADKDSAQQGYITSEPYAIEKEGGFKPKLFLLYDAGFSTPSTMIEGLRDYVKANPDITQRFVDASIIGWYNYLYGDNAAANELIKEDNPEMTDDQIAFTIDKMREYGLVESGVALDKGIGCFDDDQVHSFYDKMVKSGVLAGNVNVDDIYTKQFVCKGVGMDIKG